MKEEAVKEEVGKVKTRLKVVPGSRRAAFRNSAWERKMNAGAHLYIDPSKLKPTPPKVRPSERLPKMSAGNTKGPTPPKVRPSKRQPAASLDTGAPMTAPKSHRCPQINTKPTEPKSHTQNRAGKGGQAVRGKGRAGRPRSKSTSQYGPVEFQDDAPYVCERAPVPQTVLQRA